MTRYDYLRKYASEHAWSPSTSPETIEHARAAIHAIQNKQEVSISMLESVVSLTYYFGSFTGLLNDPALIQHCVICLCQRERKGAQVFDDEWGYLCFRILVLAINASMISKYHHPAVWDTLLSMHGRQDADEQLSDSLNAFLAQQVHNPHPDRIIGWSPQGIHPTIISKANTLLLLDLLFKDRKGLLRAWSETRSPTLTGLLFVLWRFAHVASMPNHWISFIDLARRNYLITKADFSNAIQTFQEDAHQHVDIWFSRRTLTAVDLEDARLQLSILTKRLRSEPSTGICVVPFTLSFYFLVGFSLPNADEKFIPGVEDLFIPLLREAFGGFWRCFKIGVASLIIRPDLIRKRIGLLIITINLMLDHLEIRPTDLVSRKEVLQAAADMGVIEILAKAISFTHDYDGNNNTDKTTQNIVTFKKFANTVRCISQFEDLGTMFADTTTDWLKAFIFKGSQDTFNGTATQEEKWFRITMGFWHELGASLGYILPTTEHIKNVPLCSYTRCPDPVATDTNALKCICGKAVYCGVRCQQLDWAMYLPTSHRLTCTWSEVD